MATKIAKLAQAVMMGITLRPGKATGLNRPMILTTFIGGAMSVITIAQKKIMVFLKGKNFVSPTRISEEVAGLQHQSAWASPKCLDLFDKGILKRNHKGHYALIG